MSEYICIEHNSSACNDCVKEMQRIEKERDSTLTENSLLKETNGSLSKQVEELKGKLVDYKAECEKEFENRGHAFQEAIRASLLKNLDLQKRLEEARGNSTALKELYDNLHSTWKACRAELDSQKAGHKMTAGMLSKAELRCAALEGENARYKAALEEIDSFDTTRFAECSPGVLGEMQEIVGDCAKIARIALAPAGDGAPLHKTTNLPTEGCCDICDLIIKQAKEGRADE